MNKERFYPLIPGFAEWRDKLLSLYDRQGMPNNEQVAELIKECPVDVAITGLSICPQWMEVPGETPWSAEKEYFDPSITFNISINIK